jgi:hypothetical protein
LGETPEGIRNDTHGHARRLLDAERLVVHIGHARHDQRAGRTKGILQRVDQAARPALDWTDFRERRMHDEHASWFDAKRKKLLDELRAGDRWLRVH